MREKSFYTRSFVNRVLLLFVITSSVCLDFQTQAPVIGYPNAVAPSEFGPSVSPSPSIAPETFGSPSPSTGYGAPSGPGTAYWEKPRQSYTIQNVKSKKSKKKIICLKNNTLNLHNIYIYLYIRIYNKIFNPNFGRRKDTHIIFCLKSIRILYILSVAIKKKTKRYVVYTDNIAKHHNTPL